MRLLQTCYQSSDLQLDLMWFITLSFRAMMTWSWISAKQIKQLLFVSVNLSHKIRDSKAAVLEYKNGLILVPKKGHIHYKIVFFFKAGTQKHRWPRGGGRFEDGEDPKSPYLGHRERQEHPITEFIDYLRTPGPAATVCGLRVQPRYLDESCCCSLQTCAQPKLKGDWKTELVLQVETRKLTAAKT